MSITVIYPEGQVCANPGDFVTFQGPVLLCSTTGVTVQGVNATLLFVGPVFGGDECAVTIRMPDIGAAPNATAEVMFSFFAGGSAQTTLAYCGIPCLAPKTKVLMADGTQKEIQHIQRGDLVACDVSRERVVRVSQVKKNGYLTEMVREAYVFAPGTIVGNTGELRVTEYHPIMYAGARREARAFRGVPGVTHHLGPLKDVMDPDNTGNYTVYDLQFDTEGQYVAEGAVVQSRSPNYTWDPLPKELYFDVSLYRDERTIGTINHPVPMDNSPLVTSVSFQVNAGNCALVQCTNE